MLLTISTTHRPATDLGFLLHKHPDRVQRFEQPFGTATVVYPEAADDRCTAALVLEIDPIRLARTRGRTSPDFSLAQYVNDRPYAASSLLGAAMADVFSTARAGRCRSRQELADTAIPLRIELPVLPCRGGPEIAHRLFAPLGWEVDATPIVLDPAFPDWGDSRYVGLRLTGTVRLADALNQLYVLLPVLDESKHYWQSADEVDKLLRSGEGWLGDHPERELITRRYLGRSRTLAAVALERLAEVDGVATESADVSTDAQRTEADDTAGQSLRPTLASSLAQGTETGVPLNRLRHRAVLAEIARLGASSVIDLGCGTGSFLRELVTVGALTRIAGCDVSTQALQIAGKRLKLERLGERAASRIELFQGALTYSDDRFAGFDVAVLMEVIEHVDLPRLAALERVVFAEARPGAVLITTPNSEYNPVYEGLTGLRHHDHRFEWDRATITAWAERVAADHGYRVQFSGVGDADPERGHPTQLATFVRDETAGGAR